MEHRKADVRQVTGYGASADDAARFLRELRQLRDGAGLGHAELAARAHFPYDSIRAAEVGPALPDLPVLSAYVRGCGGTTEEWEERWRSLTRSPSLPVSASRHAGNSDAATAGARIGSVPQVGDSPDPSIIIAALNRVAEEMASANDGADPSPSAVAAVDDFPAPEASLPSGAGAAPAETAAFPVESEAYQSVPEPEPVTDSKPAGWDPIRVSTAWPAIRDTPPAVTEPANGRRPARAKSAGRAESADRAQSSGSTGLSGSTGPAGGSGLGVPWGTPSPWAEDAMDAASPVTGAARAASQAGGQAANARVSPAAPAAGAGGAARSASLTKIAVLAAVLLCVLAVVLAVLA